MYTWILERSFVITWISLVTLFYIATLVGSLLYHAAPETIKEQIVLWISEYYKSRVPGLTLNPIVLFMVVLINNTVVAIVAWLLSITVVVPLLTMLVNGLLVGFIVSLVASLGGAAGGGYNYLSLYLSLAPHGIIEIPAIALASSSFAIALTRGFKRFISSLPSVLILALIMIAIAAIVESTITIILAMIATYIAWM
ncbi:MAG: stage II sporulation protein M [Desulfurococcaceae archaeon]|jgi:uncharacterized membrane protein SpoIIM required for sporulation|nr:stage II sporulation protein M [Desulfurococcaceae archaeon]MCC6060076.1 stage II sporulation protein M [Desulfurococcaceae archaeon]